MTPIFVSAMLCLCIPVKGSAAERCAGELHEPHNLEYHNFVTTSRVYQSNNVWAYETCVENHASRDLEIRWYIPQFHTWVLAGQAIPQARAKDTKVTLPYEKGCLRYGGNWTPSAASFFPHESEAGLLDDEKQLGCVAVVNRETQQSAVQPAFDQKFTIEEFKWDTQVFAPIDPNLASETMVHIGATIAMSGIEATGYTHTLMLFAEPAYPDRFKGDVRDLRLIPRQEFILTTYSQQQGTDAIELAKTKTIELKLPSPKYPVLQNITYDVVNPRQRVVASLNVPFWLEAAQ